LLREFFHRLHTAYYYWYWLLLLLLIIAFVKSIYYYIPETNHVSGVYNIADILWLRLMLRVILSPTMNVM
jgi:hypothetical protein